MRKIGIKIQVEEVKTLLPGVEGKISLPEYKTKDSAGCDLINNGCARKLLPLDRAAPQKPESLNPEEIPDDLPF